jgi:hypothetical protein
MACTEARDLMVLYMGGLLDPLRRVELESHVDVCGDCQQQYEAARLGFQLMLELYPPIEMDVEGFVAKVDGFLPDEPPPKVLAAPRWLLGLAGLALLIGLVMSVGSLIGAGEVDAVAGTVTVSRMGEGVPTDVKQHTRLHPGDTMETGYGGKSILHIGRQVMVTLFEGTSVRLVGSRGGLEADLDLERGQIEVAVLLGFQRLTVFTPAGRMRVAGTKFRVRVIPDGHSPGVPLVSLEVLSGSVEWSGDWGLDTITSGTCAEATPGFRPRLYPIPSFADESSTEPSPSASVEVNAGP